MKPIRIIDSRNKEKFQIDDVYLNGYAKRCGWQATMAYLCLCRHSNYITQESFPSVEMMAEKVGISRDSIMRGIKALLKWNLIAVKRDRDASGIWLRNTYVLLDKSVWIKDQVAVGNMANQVANSLPSQVAVGDSNVNYSHTYNETHKHETSLKPQNSTTDLKAAFEVVWASYPRRVGKKEAMRHFVQSVKTPEDVTAIKKALEAYRGSKEVQGGFIQHGSTWFNNWQDWIPQKETATISDVQRKKDKLSRKECTQCVGGKIEEHENRAGEKRMMCNQCGSDYTRRLHKELLQCL